MALTVPVGTMLVLKVKEPEVGEREREPLLL